MVRNITVYYQRILCVLEVCRNISTESELQAKALPRRHNQCHSSPFVIYW